MVVVAGVGLVPVGRHWGKSLRDLAVEAGRAAAQMAGADEFDYLILSTSASYLEAPQFDPAAYVAAELGLHAARTLTVEAGESSGLAALEVAKALIESEAAERVLLVGADKLTEYPSGPTYAMLQSLYDTEAEGFYKIGHAGVAGLLMRLYMEAHGVDRETMAYWPAMMHSHAKHNKHAMLRFAIDPSKVPGAMPVADPITLLDSYPLGDGAAAVVLEAEDSAGKGLARVTRVDSARGLPSVALRDDPLRIESLESLVASLDPAPADFDFVEIHDDFTITAYLILEALGLASPGRAPALVAEGRFSLDGDLPLANPSGGLKARGHPIGATGVYALAEASLIVAGKWEGVKRGGEKRGLIVSLNGLGVEARLAIVESFES